jgi:NADH-quinone oxidoreductase subunit H
MSGLWGGIAWGLAAAVLIAVSTIIGVWLERKVSGRVQMRFGPQQAGPFGLFQIPADTLKLILKEDITPFASDQTLFKSAPFFVFVPIASSLAVIPFAFGWAPFDITTGVLFFLAVPSISVVGILIAGWSSRNTFATIGGIRGAAQMISYELPRTLSVLAICVLAGSISTTTVQEMWRWWWMPLTLIALVVYFIASIAELNRGPFDLPEAEGEIVAGYFADYSGIRWAIFMMSEYGGVVAASLFGSVLFFGRGLGFDGIPGALLFVGLTFAFATAMIWVKWTLPRMRPDQLMRLAWKVLTPLALVQLLIVGVVAPWL